MVIKIHQTINTEKAFSYNEKKVEQKEATFYHSANTLSKNPFVYSNSRRLKELLDIQKLNTRVKNKCLHISVNPSLSDLDKMDDKMIKKEIDNMMNHMGYGDQPYYVYKHQDLDRVHFHIVSSRIDKQTGKKINDSNEKRRLQVFLKDLEIKYQLDNQNKQEKIDFKFSPHSRNIKQSLENLFYHLNQTKEIQTKEMYEKALKLFNVEVRKSGRGHIVVVTDGEGKVIRYPIRLSKFTNHPEFYAIKEIVKKEKSMKSSQHKKIQPNNSFLKELIWQSLIYKGADAPDKKPKSKKKPKKKYRRRM